MDYDRLPDILRELRSNIGEKCVTYNKEFYRIDGLECGLFVRPTNLDHLSKVMSIATKYKLAVTPRGGGTMSALGNPPARMDLIVDTSNLNTIIHHNPADMTINVQAGITLTNLQRILGCQGQFLAIDPPLPDHSTIGGILASGASGPLRWHYGHPRDSVIGMKVVQADGTITKSGGQVVKNVSGYDMSRLHIGGLGTLGIISEVAFKLTPVPKTQETVVALFETYDAALAAAIDIFQSAFNPLSLATFKETGNNPSRYRSSDATYKMAVKLNGRPQSVKRQIADCISICKPHHPKSVNKPDHTEEAQLWQSLSDFGWAGHPAPEILAQANVLPDTLPKLWGTIENSCPDNLYPSMVSQPGFGVLQIAWFAKNTSTSLGDLERVLNDARNATHQLEGNLTIQKCQTAIKEHFDVWDTDNQPINLIQRMKSQFDPLNLLNPGRFIGGI